MKKVLLLNPQYPLWTFMVLKKKKCIAGMSPLVSHQPTYFIWKSLFCLLTLHSMNRKAMKNHHYYKVKWILKHNHEYWAWFKYSKKSLEYWLSESWSHAAPLAGAGSMETRHGTAAWKYNCFDGICNGMDIYIVQNTLATFHVNS